jgi:catecholate siderophore receptor
MLQPAQQAPLEPWKKGAAAQGSSTVRRDDSPPGPLDPVVPAFRNATGIKLRAGTGIDYRFTGANKVTLEVSGVATSVKVTESVDALAASSPKYSQPITESPQTIDEVPREVMDQQGATTLRDALRNVAGISLAAGEGGAQGDNLTIRGFTARNDLFIDGMRDFGSYYRDPFNVQEVEALQGPSSVTFRGGVHWRRCQSVQQDSGDGRGHLGKRASWHGSDAARDARYQ